MPDVPLRYRILVGISLPLLLLDQWIKFYIDRSFALYESVQVIKNFFNITYVRNRGAAFGMLADSSLRMPLFIIIAIVAGGAILFYLHRMTDEQKLGATALALIFSGAIGNLVDRIRLGEVIDFLDAHWYGHHWPAFNIADSAITVGVGLLILDMWREDRRKKREDAAD
ncbi:signal peptidase II [Geothermobacter hydrogeniphilus]|uniref:Lipoprotein signal peptidase n=1 Tax=Geothermobacter hydrogeniphilus TaxID=1969733 RepID=A0A1X0XPU3_9BACT|nr:signal peptidase II [Geothermobacter hydrogeniphilus]